MSQPRTVVSHAPWGRAASYPCASCNPDTWPFPVLSLPPRTIAFETLDFPGVTGWRWWRAGGERGQERETEMKDRDERQDVPWK